MPKSVGGLGSAPDPVGEAHDDLPYLLVGWGGDNPRSPRRLRRFDSRAFCAQLLRPPQCKILATPLYLATVCPEL